MSEPLASSLANLRVEIDRIDAEMHCALHGARPYHRFADRNQSQAGRRFGFSAWARGFDDARACGKASRPAAARYCRRHMADYHFDLHFCSGPLLRPRRRLPRRRGHARFGALSFWFYGALRPAYERGGRHGGGACGGWRSGNVRVSTAAQAPAPGGFDLRPEMRQKSLRDCPSSSDRTIRPVCRCL